jgi:hypothetical protein
LSASQWNHDVTIKVRDLVEGVAGARARHPGKAILLYGADSEQFWNAIRDKVFPLVGIYNVYLAPGSEKQIVQPASWGRVEDYELAPAVVSAALDHKDLEVYDVRGPILRNITTQYAADAPHESELPLRVGAADTLTAWLLGPEWYSLETDHRWMPRRATLRMGAPKDPGKKLYLTGHSPDILGPVEVTVTVDETALPPQTVHPGPFEAVFPLPDSVLGKPEMRVAVEVSRTFRPVGDPRDLGLSFGTFEVR